MGVYLDGKSLRNVGRTGEMLLDDNFFIVFNAHHETLEYRVPFEKYGKNWMLVIDTARGYISEEGKNVFDSKNENVLVSSRSIVVLKQLKFS